MPKYQALIEIYLTISFFSPFKLKLYKLNEYLTYVQVRDDSTGVGTSIGSQTDLGSDLTIEQFPRRDKQELKAEYKEALKHESKLQSAITRLDEKITQVMADDNNSRPMLLQEKEVLLEEIRRLNSLVRSEGEKVSKRPPRQVFSAKF